MNYLAQPRGGDLSQLTRLYDPIAEHLAQVEHILRKEFTSEHPSVHELVEYGRLLGGKRLRPALLLLIGQACGGSLGAQHHLLAAVIEMIHTATLVHDDVLDEAQTRRHLATVNTRWDNRASILLGDFLFSHAFYLAATTGSTQACQLIGRATNIVCEGEMRQKATCGDYSLSEDDYLSIISAKTAELCACSCELGAMASGADPDLTSRLAGYGRDLGIAFQIVDDVLDLNGDEHETGKSLGTDFDQRIPTLPLIWLLNNRLAPDERTRLLQRLTDGDEDLRGELLAMFEQHGALAFAIDCARRFARRAAEAVACLPPSPATDVLRQLPHFVTERSS